ncbi:MAG TPA: prephenate dehydrogenase/arogenate dehydrogenase family protein [Bacteroidales bacterium]|nr:prephenate dehydrogenase/arogenate dehydrogenase family protein [Bacteroidales bacterium]
MRIVIIGAGNMGSWLVESLCLDYEVGIYDADRSKLKYFFNSRKFLYLEEIFDFSPDILINAVSLEKTIQVFNEVLPYLPEDCILADITSVKKGMADFYASSGRKFVSTHPMFGPTFGDIRNLRDENAIIIKESDPDGAAFFRKLYTDMQLKLHDFSFDEHDQTIAYSLSLPFSSSLVFASCMKTQDAPGTTFRKHNEIARGLLSEDDYLLSEILMSPYSLEQIEKVRNQLNGLIDMIKSGDKEPFKSMFDALRANVGMTD